MLLNIIDKLFNLRKPVEVEGAISGDVALTDGDLTVGGNEEVDGNLTVNGSINQLSSELKSSRITADDFDEDYNGYIVNFNQKNFVEKYVFILDDEDVEEDQTILLFFNGEYEVVFSGDLLNNHNYDELINYGATIGIGEGLSPSFLSLQTSHILENGRRQFSVMFIGSLVVIGTPLDI